MDNCPMVKRPLWSVVLWTVGLWTISLWSIVLEPVHLHLWDKCCSLIWNYHSYRLFHFVCSHVLLRYWMLKDFICILKEQNLIMKQIQIQAKEPIPVMVAIIPSIPLEYQMLPVLLWRQCHSKIWKSLKSASSKRTFGRMELKCEDFCIWWIEMLFSH